MLDFELKDGAFYSYNNKSISSNIPRSHLGKSEESLMRQLAYNFLQRRSKPKLSLRFKLQRFFTHFKWSDKYYTSGNGKINDSKFYINEIVFYLSKISNLTHFSSAELRELLISGIRVYIKFGYESVPINFEDLNRCKNLQRFYSHEFGINFEFAEGLKNLRVVDLWVNDANIKNGKTNSGFRKVLNVEKLKSCVVLYLNDSYLNDYNKIPENIRYLSVRNSNFDNLQTLNHLRDLEYLDISYTKITKVEDISNLSSLRVINMCCVKFQHQEEINKIFNQILKLDKLEILIIDSDNLNLISNNALINFKNKIIELPTNYFIGYISSFEICKIFKISDVLRDKILDFDIDYEKIKMSFVKLLLK